MTNIDLIIYLVGIPVSYAVMYAFWPEWKKDKNNQNNIFPCSLLWPLLAMVGVMWCCYWVITRPGEMLIDSIKSAYKKTDK